MARAALQRDGQRHQVGVIGRQRRPAELAGSRGAPRLAPGEQRLCLERVGQSAADAAREGGARAAPHGGPTGLDQRVRGGQRIGPSASSALACSNARGGRRPVLAPRVLLPRLPVAIGARLRRAARRAGFGSWGKAMAGAAAPARQSPPRLGGPALRRSAVMPPVRRAVRRTARWRRFGRARGRAAPARCAPAARSRQSRASAASPRLSCNTARLWAARKLPRPRTVSLSCGCSPISSARSQLDSIIGSSSPRVRPRPRPSRAGGRRA